MQTIYYKGQYININFNQAACYVVLFDGVDYFNRFFNTFIGAKRGISKFNKDKGLDYV